MPSASLPGFIIQSAYDLVFKHDALDSIDWQLSAANSDQFTVECFVRFPSWNANNRGSAFDTTITTTGAGMTTGVRYHVAVDKDSSGKVRVYVDGVMLGSATPANSSIFNAISAPLAIEAHGVFGQVDMDGWLDEIRITKGVARYASDGGFTVPTAASRDRRRRAVTRASGTAGGGLDADGPPPSKIGTPTGISRDLRPASATSRSCGVSGEFI